MKVTKRDGIPKIRQFERLVGVCHGGLWGVHNHNLANVVRGLRERVFCVEGPSGLRPPPRPKAGAFSSLNYFRNALVRQLDLCRPWTPEQFLDSYHGAKKLLYKRAFDSLTLRPVIRRDSELKTFVKAEKLNFSKKPDPAPRVIQPRDMRFNCVVGPYLKPLEHKLYQGVARIFGSPTIMKGYDAIAQGRIIHTKWKRFNQPVAIGLDASRFDQHVSADALRWEHSVYNGIYKCDKLAKLLSWQILNRGVAYTPDGKVKYEVDGCRMSGDMNTALGNCLLMCALIHWMMKEAGLDFELVNNGDDCVIIMDTSSLAKLPDIKQWFLRFGFNMKVEDPVYTIELIEFCQTHPVYAGDGYRMVRDPRIAMDKDGINLRPGNQRFETWLGSVGECGLALCSGVPIMQAYYGYLLSCGHPGAMETSGMMYLRGTMKSVRSNINDLSRVSFWRAFGVAPHQQVDIERSLNRLVGYDDDGMIMIGAVHSLVDYQF